MTEIELINYLAKQPEQLPAIVEQLTRKEWPAQLGPEPPGFDIDWWRLRDAAKRYRHNADEEDELDYFAAREVEG
jgi:hypothetical protein